MIVDLFAGGGEKPATLPCEHCGALFVKTKPWHRFCSALCNQRRRFPGPEARACRSCGTEFRRKGRGDSNRWHCSPACAVASARKSRLEFKRRRPEREPVYRERQRAKKQRDTALERLWKKYPWMPRTCEACGESRVLDIAHRPEFARKGAWRLMSNTTPERIWVLCPRCHALLDRLGYSKDQLGIKERPVPEVAEALVAANLPGAMEAERAA